MSTRSVACQAPPRSGWLTALRRVQAMADDRVPLAVGAAQARDQVGAARPRIAQRRGRPVSSRV
jgi:hypothetical protein